MCTVHHAEGAAPYPAVDADVSRLRQQLTPAPAKAFRTFTHSVFAAGALPTRTKHLIAVAVAHVTQCPYCIQSHTETALDAGATKSEIMEAIWVAAEMRAGAAVAHSAIALDIIARQEAPTRGPALIR